VVACTPHRVDWGDQLFVSADVADYLDHLHELGVSERSVHMDATCGS
jgi:hypothetical protein